MKVSVELSTLKKLNNLNGLVELLPIEKREVAEILIADIMLDFTVSAEPLKGVICKKCGSTYMEKEINLGLNTISGYFCGCHNDEINSLNENYY